MEGLKKESILLGKNVLRGFIAEGILSRKRCGEELALRSLLFSLNMEEKDLASEKTSVRDLNNNRKR